MTRALAALVLALAVAGAAQAQQAPQPEPTPTPSPSPTPEPPQTAIGVWLWKGIAVTKSERKEYWGGRVNAGASFGPWRVGGRVDVAALPGQDQFSFEDVQAYQSIEAYASVAHDLAVNADAVSLSAGLVVGGSVPFERSVETARLVDYVVGVGPSANVKGIAYAYALVTVDTMTTGKPHLCLAGSVQTRLTPNTALMIDGRGGENGFVRAAVAVRLQK